MNYPEWATKSESMRLRYCFAVCINFHNPDRSQAKFAEALGFSANAINTAVAHGSVSRKMAIAVEQLVGRDVMTRELLSPKRFAA